MVTERLGLAPKVDNLARAGRGWAFADEHRRAGYNIVVTGISVVVAIVIGGIELLQVAREQLPQAARFTELVASVYLSNVGYLVTAVIVTVWVCAVGRVRATKPA